MNNTTYSHEMSKKVLWFDIQDIWTVDAAFIINYKKHSQYQKSKSKLKKTVRNLALCYFKDITISETSHPVLGSSRQ